MIRDDLRTTKVGAAAPGKLPGKLQGWATIRLGIVTHSSFTALKYQRQRTMQLIYLTYQQKPRNANHTTGWQNGIFVQDKTPTVTRNNAATVNTQYKQHTKQS